MSFMQRPHRRDEADRFSAMPPAFGPFLHLTDAFNDFHEK
jgi:hypothetical protein